MSEVDAVQRLSVVGRGGEPAEGPGDGVQPIDLRQDPLRGFFQGAVEVSSAVPIDPAQVLHAEPHGRERVLDLVRHLACHLAPGQHPLRPGDDR